MAKQDQKQKTVAQALKNQKKTVVGACAELLARKEVDWALKEKKYKLTISILTGLLLVSGLFSIVLLVVK